MLNRFIKITNNVKLYARCKRYNDFFLFQSSEYGITSNGARITSKRAPRGPIFHIAKVRKEDAGTYICTATNGVGTMSADQIELNVLCKL